MQRADDTPRVPPAPQATASSPAPAVGPGAGGRLISIDALRGFAALWVVIGHLEILCWSGLGYDSGSWWLWPTRNCYIAVRLFLVLSGFCIHLRLARGPVDQPMRLPLVSFWKRRMRRLYPAYAVALLFSMAMVVLSHMNYHGDWSAGRALAAFDAHRWDVLAHLLMLHLFIPAFMFGAGNGAFWSLALEEHLYALYQPMIWLRNRLGIWGTMGVAAVVSAAWQLGCFLVIGWELAATSQTFWYMQAPGLWLSWCMGALAAEAWTGRTRMPRWLVSWPIFFVALAIGLLDRRFAWSMMIRDTMWAVCCMVVIVRFTRAESAGRPWLGAGGSGRLVNALAGVGLFSYSLYLIHQPMLGLARMVGAWLGFAALGVALTATAAVPVIVLAAFGWYRLFEKPFMRTPAQTTPSHPTLAASPAHSATTPTANPPPVDQAA